MKVVGKRIEMNPSLGIAPETNLIPKVTVTSSTMVSLVLV
jgi:hypothetical protein